ncbi:alkylglycerol monooxygenase isoform 3-T3 [Cyanocitta cristata]
MQGNQKWQAFPTEALKPSGPWGNEAAAGRGGEAGLRRPGGAERSQRGRAMGAEAGSPRDTALGQQLRALFYALLPGESSFRTVEEVPNYVDKSIPFFITFIGLEFAVSWIQKRKLPGRINDGITSLSLGILSRLPDVLFRSIDLISYIYIWNNYRLLELPWDSPWTWYLTLLGVDFAYYCFHRISHEVNILWAAHQVHHSSEDYNLFTALRQSVLQKYTSWMFNLPMALFIPPSVFAVHLQFNLLYQFWIHTEVITKLGPLEWILNTPSHHRVHHGRNPYCIDKNYGGTLIIWDRIFGTFEAEDEKVVYGLTHPVNSFDPIMLQMLSQGTVLLRIGFIILSLSSFGLLLENKSKAGILEIIRCLVFIGVYKLGYFRSQFSILGYAYEVLFSLCAAFWGIQIMKRITSFKDKHH